MEQKQFLSELRKHFRLNIYEVKVWTALLGRGIASAGELAEISGVPRSRCYDVLESLEKKSFIIMKIGKPIKYLGVEPEVILDRVKRSIKEDADKLSTQIESIRGTEEFKELEMLHKTGIKGVDISNISKSMVGRTGINRHVKEMLANAKSKVTVVSNQEHAERSVKLLKAVMHTFPKKGVKARLCTPSNKSILKKLQNVEHIDYSPSSSFITVDGKEMLFMVSSANTVPEYEVGIWLHSPFFVKAVDILFEDSLR